MSNEIVVIGSGISAAGACYKLRQEGRSAQVLDKNPHPFGHTATHSYEPGFLFDEGPHVSFTSDKRFQAILADSVNGAFDCRPYILNNYWRGYWATHPVQNHLRGLPADLVTKIITEFATLGKEESTFDNYEDWLVGSYGPTFAKNFPMQYTEKYHTTPARNLTTDWIGPRMHQPNLEEVVLGALSAQPPNIHYIQEFRYPKEGGFQAYLPAFFRGIDIQLNTEVTGINPVKRTLSLGDGSEMQYGALISSIPMPSIIPMIQGVPDDVKDAANRLAWSGCVLVNLGVKRPDITDAHISYIYDEDIVFSRLSFPHNISPSCAPDGCSSIQAEIYFSEKYRPLVGKPEDYIDVTIRDLVRCGLLSDADELLVKEVVVCPYANVIFDHDWAEAIATVHGFLDEIGISYCGRYGDWDYMWTDHSFISGERAAADVLDAKSAN